VTERTVPASVFKAQCLGLLDQVAERRISLVVTKRGRPVARVVPAQEPERRPLEGSVKLLAERDEDYFSTGEAWELDVSL